MTLRWCLVAAPLALITAPAVGLAAPGSAASPEVSVSAEPAEAKDPVAAPEMPAEAPAGSAALPVTPVPPQEPTPRGRASSDDSVFVTGKPTRGSPIGDPPPIQTYNRSDVLATGAGTVGELLSSLAPQTASEQGRTNSNPVVLVNGKRVPGIEDVSQIPTEAIQRVEIFTEELALKYGFPAGQKVVNVVLLLTFNATKGNASVSTPTEGGFTTAGAGINFLRIHFDDRISLTASYSHSSSLLESERDVVQPAGSNGLGQFRTLLPEVDALSLTGSYSTALPRQIAATLSARFRATNSDSLLGLGGGAPVTYADDRRDAHAAATFDGHLGSWLWNFIGKYDRLTVDTNTVASEAFSQQTKAIDSRGEARFLASGAPFKLPAGPVQLSLQGSASANEFTSRSTTTLSIQKSTLSRDSRSVQTNIDVPIAKHEKGMLSEFGNLSLNANAAFENLSDFGSLRTLGYGLSWSPIKALHIVASETREEGAPTVDQLQAPSIELTNVRLFDFTRAETVDVTSTFGGNPVLRADSRRVEKLALVLKPYAKTDFTVSAEYLRTRIDDPIAPVVGTTAAFEAAFPQRFTRDASGRLTRFDASPINFHRSEQQLIRWGFNFSRNLGSGPSDHGNAEIANFGSIEEIRARFPNAKITIAAPGSAEEQALQKAHDAAGSRFIVSAYHTVRFEDKVQLIEGGPSLDLLRGATVDGTGGRPRHQLNLQTGISKAGVGARVNAAWTSATTLLGASAEEDLRFGSLARVNLRLFANLGKLRGSNPPTWLKTTTLNLSVDNLLNERQEVRDSMGATPVRFQPAYLDPQGRVISLRITKQLSKPPEYREGLE